MLQRLYVHNFRCLENFELNVKEMPSILLIGKTELENYCFLRIGNTQGYWPSKNRIRDLVTPDDFSWGRADVPMRFEIEVSLGDKLFKYALALELPEKWRELRVLEEELCVDTETVYSRSQATIALNPVLSRREAQFMVDWHLIALPVIQEQSETDPLYEFKSWLARIIILSPIPSMINGESQGETLQPDNNCKNFPEWFTGLLGRYPAAYTRLEKYLREVMPDIRDFMNEPIGKDAKNMVVRFEANNATLSLDFTQLSDGEKCFFICAVVLATNEYYGPLFCFWDEPDNFLSLSEVGHFVASLRSSFNNKKGQLIITSHNPEAIRKFSNENTLLLDRKSHLEPTLIRPLSDISYSGDLVSALIRGDVGV